MELDESEKSDVDDFIAKVTSVSKGESNQYLRQPQDKREREKGDYKSQWQSAPGS